MFKVFLAAIFAFVLVPCALADSMISISRLGCSMLDVNGNYDFRSNMIQVTAYDNEGIACLTDVVNHSGKRVHWDNKNTGYLCNTQFGSTDDWYEEIGPTGHVTLMCNRKDN